MKALLFSVLLALTSSTAIAASEYCQATEATLQEVEQLRVAELPCLEVQAEMYRTLRADSCIRSKLKREETDVLVELLLSDDDRQDTAEQIIGEFLAL